MGGSGGGNSTTTQKADPWSGVQPYLRDAYAQLSDLYNGGQDPRYYPGSTVAQPSQLESEGMYRQLGANSAAQSLADRASWVSQRQAETSLQGTEQGQRLSTSGGQGLQGLASQLGGGAGGVQSAMQQLNRAGDFQNNPAYQAALQSAIRPVTQNFQEQVMPAIQQGAQAAGQMGGSRQGIAEGIAARGYQDTIGDISANMGNAAYAQGLQALQASGQLGQGMAGLQGQAYSNLGGLGASLYGTGLQGQGQNLALTPATMGAQYLPGQNISALGQQQTADAQAQLDDQVQRWNYEQNLPYTMLQDYLATLNGGAALGGTQASQQSGGKPNRTTGALGGAATGAAVGSMFGPIGTGVGAVGGALYGLFA